MEIIRRFIRNIIGANSKLYMNGSIIIDYITIINKEGIQKWRLLRQLKKNKNNFTVPIAIKFKNLLNNIFVRPGTDDIRIVIDNIIREEYGKCKLTNPLWMIDAGAYIGDTSSYFLSKYENLKVVALEPNLPSYEMACMNLKLYRERSILLKKGLWKNDEKIYFGGNSTAASIQEEGMSIDGISIQTILDQFSISRLNILKMDIEGAEKEIFETSPEKWLNITDLILIEIHGNEALNLITKVLTKNNFKMKQYRSLWYCFNLNIYRH